MFADVNEVKAQAAVVTKTTILVAMLLLLDGGIECHVLVVVNELSTVVPEEPFTTCTGIVV
jgi:hypothetical protein